MLIARRIRLRSAEKTDLVLFVQWMNDPEVRQYIKRIYPLSLAREEMWFERMSSGDPATQVLVIERLNEAGGYDPIGTTSFNLVSWEHRLASLGIVIGEKSWWNQHYGREAVMLMLRYGFQALNLNRIELEVYASNPRGMHAYEHAGFRIEGRRRQAIYKNGVYQDVVMMAVLREDWQDSDF